MAPRGGKRTGAGRPRKNPAEQRKQRGLLRLTDAEYERLKRRAREAGMTASEYARRKVLE